MDNPIIRHQARALRLGPFNWVDIPIEEAIRELQVELYISSMEDGQLCPINLVFVNDDVLTIYVTLRIEGPTPLADVLDLLAGEAALIVDYQHTGIALSPMPPTEHDDEEVTAEEELPDFLGHPLPAPVMQPETLAVIVRKYPWVGEAGNLAGVRFFELFDAFRNTGTDLEALAQLITVYPTRTVRLARDQDS